MSKKTKKTTMTSRRVLRIPSNKASASKYGKIQICESYGGSDSGLNREQRRAKKFGRKTIRVIVN